MEKSYSYQINFEPDEGGYTVTIPALPGCISFGENIEEATKNATEAIKLHLECLDAHKKLFPVQICKKPCYSAFSQITRPYAR